MTTEEAMNHMREMMQTDPDYAWSWHCNVAMASVDEGMDHAAADRAAARFMFNAFGARAEDYTPASERKS